NFVPSLRNTVPSDTIGLLILHLLFERRGECFEIRFQEPDVSTDYAEMGNLHSLNPKIHSLRTDAKIERSFLHGEWLVIEKIPRKGTERNYGVVVHDGYLRFTANSIVCVRDDASACCLLKFVCALATVRRA